MKRNKHIRARESLSGAAHILRAGLAIIGLAIGYFALREIADQFARMAKVQELHLQYQIYRDQRGGGM